MVGWDGFEPLTAHGNLSLRLPVRYNRECSPQTGVSWLDRLGVELRILGVHRDPEEDQMMSQGTRATISLWNIPRDKRT